MKKHNFNSKCSLCDEKKDKYTAVLSSTHNYILCLSCYPKYDKLDNSGKKWMEAEYMDGTSLENRYGKGE
jgi:hypothetical protein